MGGEMTKLAGDSRSGSNPRRRQDLDGAARPVLGAADIDGVGRVVADTISAP